MKHETEFDSQLFLMRPPGWSRRLTRSDLVSILGLRFISRGVISDWSRVIFIERPADVYNNNCGDSPR